MSRSVANAKVPRVQKVCTLWTHDDNFSREDIVFNGDKFPELPTAPGTLLQIVAFDAATAVRDVHSHGKSAQPDAPRAGGRMRAKGDGTSGLPVTERRGSMTITIDENGSTIPGGRDIDTEKAYVFAVTALPADLKSKHANLQVSGHNTINHVPGIHASAGVNLRENRKSLRLPKPDAGHHGGGKLFLATKHLKLISIGR